MNSIIEIGGFEIKATERGQKGKGIIDLLSDFCVVSVEMTGLCPAFDEIIEIGAIRYSNGREVARFQTLVQPPECDDYYIDEFIDELTGITNEMLSKGHTLPDAIYMFSQFLGDSIIVGYGIEGALNLLYDKYQRYLCRPLTNNYMDVMRIARKLHPEWGCYRFKDVLARYGLTRKCEHRSMIDCVAIQQCYEKLCEEIAARYGTMEGFLQSTSRRSVELKTNPEWPLYQKYCVITGKLDRFSRADALRLLDELGCIVENNVTNKTNLLLIGDLEYRRAKLSGKGIKQRKAEERKLAGQDLEIISESVLYDMLAEFYSNPE